MDPNDPTNPAGGRRLDPSGTSGGDGNGHPAHDNPAHAASAAAAWKEALGRVAELREYAAYFVAAKFDGVKVTVRNLGIYAALGIVALIAMSAVITTSVVLLLVGLSMAIGAIFDPDQFWAGALIVGVLVLGGLAGGIVFGMKRLTNTSRAALVKKYESRQREQRINFGHDVRGREADPVSEVSRD